MNSIENILPHIYIFVNIEYTMDSKEFSFYVKMFSMENEMFNKWLEDQMKEKGWNKSEMARRAKLARGTITNILNGERGIGEDAINGIALALELPRETVLRAAGKLPPVSDTEMYLEQFRDILERMSAEERNQYLQFGHVILNSKRQAQLVQEKSKKTK